MHNPPARLPIRHLPAQLADQIAAGEVVERPASVLKELVENALDAGGRRLEIDAERGGIALIRVRDDGSGIPRDELALALSRHATSKVSSLADLERIASLGFRGEALASIASVSRLVLSSRTAAQESGWRLAAAGPPEAAPSPAPHPPGTTVEVRDLFFNTPARRKFLRSERTEFIHLHETVKRIALGRFEAGIVFRHNGRLILGLRPASDRAGWERRLGEVLGRGFLQHARFLEFDAAGLRLWGWVADPGYCRSQSDAQFFYVNGRSVRDRLVAHAVRRAYDGLLAEGRQPGFALYLELDPGRVDVNVHPTKHEVRFRDARQVHDFIAGSLQQALRREPAAPAAPRRGVGSSASPAAGHAAAGRRRPVSVGEHLQAYAALRAPAADEAPRPGPGAPLRPLARLGRFLLAEAEAGLGLLDVHAAGVRLASLRLAPASRGGDLRAQPLLLPVSLPLPEPLAAADELPSESLRAFGFDVARAAPEAVLVRAVPAALAGVPAAALAEAALRGLAEGEDRAALAGRLARLAGPLLGECTPPGALLEALAREGGLTDTGPTVPWRNLSEAVLARWFDGSAG